MERNVPLKEEEASHLMDAIQSEPIRNLVKMAVGQARLQLIRGSEQSQEEWEQELPATPLDMEFFVRVLATAFKSEETVRRVLEGESLSKATGWDF